MNALLTVSSTEKGFVKAGNTGWKRKSLKRVLLSF